MKYTDFSFSCTSLHFLFFFLLFFSSHTSFSSNQSLHFPKYSLFTYAFPLHFPPIYFLIDFFKSSTFPHSPTRGRELRHESETCERHIGIRNKPNTNTFSPTACPCFRDLDVHVTRSYY